MAGLFAESAKLWADPEPEPYAYVSDYLAGPGSDGNWIPICDPFDTVVKKLAECAAYSWEAEREVNIATHRVLEDAISAFGLTPDYDQKLAIFRKVLSLFSASLNRCESPIEEIMLFGLLTTFSVFCAGDWCLNTDGSISFDRDDDLGGEVLLRQQVTIGRYRVDFLLASKCGRKVVIECDGHEFHDRTAEQAQRDKSRDRWLQTQGLIVLRFTGSEIYRRPAQCAGEVFDALSNWRPA